MNDSNYSYKQADPEYNGEPLNPLIKHGPIEHRQCRDFFCLVIYLFVWCAVFIIAGYSFAYGTPNLLFYPFDSTGYHCGISPGYEQFPNIYYNNSNPNQFACINTCPISARKVNLSQCRYNNQSINCTLFGSYSTDLVGHICYPSTSPITFVFELGLQVGEMWINDLGASYLAIVFVFIASFIVSIVWMAATRYCTKCMAWGSIVLHLLGLIGLGAITFAMAEDPHFRQQVTDYSQLLQPTYLKILSYILWGIAAISLVFLLCSIRKIQTAIKILQFSTKMLVEQASIIFVPIIVSILLLGVLSFYIALFVFMFSDGTFVGCSSSPYGCIDWNQKLRRFFGFAAFGLLWNFLIIVHFTQFIISSVAAHWYFRSPETHPICKSVANMIRYHIGSIAFGSLVLSFMAIFRIILRLFYNCRPKQVQNNANCCHKCYYSCMSCFVNIFERFLQFVTRNAYIMMGITGQSFCNSAHSSFYLIKRHTRSYLITHDLSTVITVFSKLAIASLCSFFGYTLLTMVSYFSDQLFSPTFPTFIMFLTSLVVASIFMDVLGNTNDSVLMCYLIGKELNQQLKPISLPLDDNSLHEQLVLVFTSR